MMGCLAGGLHKNEQLAAFGVQLGEEGGAGGGLGLRNELAFADRQAQTDGVTRRGF